MTNSTSLVCMCGSCLGRLGNHYCVPCAQADIYTRKNVKLSTKLTSLVALRSRWCIREKIGLKDGCDGYAFVLCTLEVFVADTHTKIINDK